jgi:large subunit ribosomal protein L1
MAHVSKRRKGFAGKVDHAKAYAALEAMKLVKQTATAKFDEAVDVAVNLGIDAKKGEQTVRGAVVLPAGTGKKIRVAVFAAGDKAEAARSAGADIVGMEDLAEQVKGGKIDFDMVIAAPEAMRVVGGLGQILGPRGLMPNPKTGTVTFDVGKAVSDAKAGKLEYRTDRGGNVHLPIGKKSFDERALLENYATLVEEIVRAKPSAAKGRYIKQITLTTTMGPGIHVDSTKTRDVTEELADANSSRGAATVSA